MLTDASTSISTQTSTVGSPLSTPVGRSSPRCVFLNTCYDAFLAHHYRQRPALLHADYDAQLRSINETFFGDSDFYSQGLGGGGIDAHDLVVNCLPLQQAWAAQHGSPESGWNLVVRQLEALQPDIVYVQDMAGTPAELLALLKRNGTFVVGQIACAVTTPIPFGLYDIVFSSFPHFVDTLRHHGICAYYQPLAFEPRVLSHLVNPTYTARDIQVSFVGGISSFHQTGGMLLERLAEQTPISIWGYGIQNVPPESATARRHLGEAWGLEMFSLLNRSKITINRHSEAAGSNANNMRLFEATGCGALLITDYKDNLNELFEIGREVVAYRSPEECVALARYYLEHPAEAEAIAQAGQARTLRDHSYTARMRKSGEILKRHLKHRVTSLPAPPLDLVSTGFQSITGKPTDSRLLNGWKEESVARSQRGLVQQELTALYAGRTPMPFEVAARLLKPVVKSGDTVLELGCSSGYYYEALEYLLKRSLTFTGVDYSPHMIAMAKEFYPAATFIEADGAALPFANHSFEHVISGGVLLHCPNYPRHIVETCRVAQDTILLHRTPIAHSGTTTILEKSAYGVPTVELWFSESEVLGLFAQLGFRCAQRLEYSRNPSHQMSEVSFLLRRASV